MSNTSAMLIWRVHGTGPRRHTESEAATVIQATARGMLIRNALVWTPRREFLSIVRHVERGKVGDLKGVGWPHPRTLCLPLFRGEEKEDSGAGKRETPAESSNPAETDAVDQAALEEELKWATQALRQRIDFLQASVFEEADRR